MEKKNIGVTLDNESAIFIYMMMNKNFNGLVPEDKKYIINRYMYIASFQIMRQSFEIDVSAYINTPELNFDDKNREMFEANISNLEKLIGMKIINTKEIFA